VLYPQPKASNKRSSHSTTSKPGYCQPPPTAAPQTPRDDSPRSPACPENQLSGKRGVDLVTDAPSRGDHYQEETFDINT